MIVIGVPWGTDQRCAQSRTIIIIGTMGFNPCQSTYMSGTNRVILETMNQPMSNNKHHLLFIGQ